MILLLLGWCSIAMGGTAAVAVDGPLLPGRLTTIEIGALPEVGTEHIRAETPAVRLEGGTLQGQWQLSRPGVWRARVLPGVDSQALTVRVGDAPPSILAISRPEPNTTLRLPKMVEAIARGDAVLIDIESDVPLTADSIEVISAEGQPQIVSGDGATHIVLTLDDLPYARLVPIGVRIEGQDNEPVWTLVRVHARPRIPLRSEPGAQLTLSLGGRSYGPFLADAEGNIDARVDQYPGENVANAVLVDDLGNETRTSVPLASQPIATLIAMATGDMTPARPPIVYLRAVTPDGEAPTTLPVCRTQDQKLFVLTIDDGRYMVPLPTSSGATDTRLTCIVGQASVHLQVSSTSGVAEHLALRVWPDELITGSEEAELSVVLDDTHGERLSTEGITVRAQRGQISLQAGGQVALRGSYDGHDALDIGSDIITAQYRSPLGAGPVDQLVFGFGEVPTSGPLQVHARALDARKRPLFGVSIRFEADGQQSNAITAVTGPDGWASGTLTLAERPRGEAATPRILRASSTYRLASRSAAAILLPGEPAQSVPGTADLEASQTITLRSGRVSGLSIEVDPPILRNAPGAIAWVYVRLEDSAGKPVTGETVTLSTTEGELSELKARGDGTLVAEYTPLPDVRAREVEITAQTETVHSSARLQLEPKVMRWSIGGWVGGHTNLGSIRAPAAGLDLDVRIRSRLAGESMVLRLSGEATSFRSEAVTDVGPPVELRSTLVPIGLGVLFRQDMGPWSLCGGGGGVFAVHALQVRFGDSLVSAGPRLLIGPQLLAGLGHRAPLGEIVLSVTAHRLPAANDDVGYAGNLGGIAGGLGWRLVY